MMPEAPELTREEFIDMVILTTCQSIADVFSISPHDQFSRGQVIDMIQACGRELCSDALSPIAFQLAVANELPADHPITALAHLSKP
jgi:hypothetical protein